MAIEFTCSDVHQLLEDNSTILYYTYTYYTCMAYDHVHVHVDVTTPLNYDRRLAIIAHATTNIIVYSCACNRR